MTQSKEQLAGLLDAKSEEIRESEILLAESISRLEVAMEHFPAAVIQPEKVYEFLEETETRVEQLTRSLYSAMETHALLPGIRSERALVA